MKNLIKILLLASFAVVVFLPNRALADGLYWLLFFTMFFLLFLYYRFSYWVGVKQVESVIGEPVLFSMFCGKVPPIAAEDLVRGRLVVTSSRVVLYQKNTDRNRSADPCVPVWTVDIGGITGFSIGKVVALRKGLILYLQEGGDARFTYMMMVKKKDAFTEALGWMDSSGMQEP
jgi:energy-coupling factor transporter transmembrane protein EcfT